MTFRFVRTLDTVEVQDYYGRLQAKFYGFARDEAANRYVTWLVPGITRIPVHTFADLIAGCPSEDVRKDFLDEIAKHHPQCMTLVSGNAWESLAGVRRGPRKIWSCHVECPTLKAEAKDGQGKAGPGP